MVSWLSVLWRDRIDSACVLITQWVEEVMVGKKTVLGSLSGLTASKGTMVMNGNGLGNGSLEKQVMELSVSQV
jgi:ABC-type cobalamin transport system ATPase subunit